MIFRKMLDLIKNNKIRAAICLIYGALLGVIAIESILNEISFVTICMATFGALLIVTGIIEVIKGKRL